MAFWLKLLHIFAMAVWFAGLFFLPRLFLARRRDEDDGEAGFFNPMANALFFRVATPAALATIALGMLLIARDPAGGAWLVMKLVVVALAVLLHLYYGLLLYELGQGNERHGPWFYRLAGWLPLLLLLAMAAITGAKPDSAAGLPPPPAQSAPR
jgi:protoporphyrinogen IX oxidase